ncbi:MAG: hypothetical protein MUC62_10860 [Candidatus Thermoplasmatota archaeon]|nr:hypothetical protein [Candidatus Thermoplasmatota archaeon]
MAEEKNDLIEELDLLHRLPARRSLTKRDDIGRITSIGGSRTDLHERDISFTVTELEKNLDSMLGSIQEFQGFLSRTKGRI